MMANRSRWSVDDAEAVQYLLKNRFEELDDYEKGVVEGLAKKRPRKDTISVNQRVFFDGIWERKAPANRATKGAG